MAAVGSLLLAAIDSYRDDLIQWHEAEYGNLTENYSDAPLKVLESFYGHQQLQQECEKEMANVWSRMNISDGAALADIALSDTQWGYGVLTVATCPDKWDPFDLDKLFKLTQEGEKSFKIFSMTMYLYRLNVARLPCILSGETSIKILPWILEKLFHIMMQSFDKRDRIYVLQ